MLPQGHVSLLRATGMTYTDPLESSRNKEKETTAIEK